MVIYRPKTSVHNLMRPSYFFQHLSESIEINPIYGNLSSDIIKIDSLNCIPNCRASVGTQIQASFKFNVTQSLNKTEIIKINTGSSGGSFEIELNVISRCDCGNIEKNASRCNSNGDFVCGMCECIEEWMGRACECNKFDNEDKNDLECKKDGEICTGRGNCNCGTCECADGYSGKFCECDNNSCPRKESIVCSGQGDCKCGTCECYENFKGDACECPTGNTACIKPTTQMVCSEHGECKCGKCVCFEKYYGNYCEKCISCQER